MGDLLHVCARVRSSVGLFAPLFCSLRAAHAHPSLYRVSQFFNSLGINELVFLLQAKVILICVNKKLEMCLLFSAVMNSFLVTVATL